MVRSSLFAKDYTVPVLSRLHVVLILHRSFLPHNIYIMHTNIARRLQRLVQREATRILISRSSVTKATIDYLLWQGRIIDAMNICSTTTTTTITSGVSDRYSYPVHDMADSFLRAALVKAQEETDPVEICRLFYTLHSFLSSWTKTFQLESSSSSGTNRRHYYDQPREHVSCNGDDQTNKQSFSLLAVSTTPNHVPVRRQLSFQDLLVVSTPRQQCRDWMTLHLL